MLYVIASVKLRPGGLDELRGALSVLVSETRAEPGCIAYDAHASITTPDVLGFVERWEDMEALAQHFGQPHMLAWREISSDYVMERQVEIISPAKIETR